MVSLYKDPSGEYVFKSSLPTTGSGITKHRQDSEHTETGTYKEDVGTLKKRVAQLNAKIAEMEVSEVPL